MAEYPALPLFTDAYLADTRHLTPAQHGAYLLMLMTAWRSEDCTLPNDDNYLARICGMDKRTWKSNKDTLLAFWQGRCEAKLFQKRLKDERNYVEDKRNKNVAAGNASALKRKKRHSTGVATPGQPKPNQPTPTPTIVSSEDKSSSDTPEGVATDAWQAFLEIRKKRKAENTPYAIALLHTKLEKLKEQGFSPQDVVDQSVSNSWKGLFSTKEDSNANATRGRNSGDDRNRPGIPAKQTWDDAAVAYAAKHSQPA